MNRAPIHHDFGTNTRSIWGDPRACRRCGRTRKDTGHDVVYWPDAYCPVCHQGRHW